MTTVMYFVAAFLGVIYFKLERYINHLLGKGNCIVKAVYINSYKDFLNKYCLIIAPDST